MLLSWAKSVVDNFLILLNVVRDPEEMNSNSLYKKPARSSLACPKSTHVNAKSQ
jgi:hypothetical protein